MEKLISMIVDLLQISKKPSRCMVKNSARTYISLKRVKRSYRVKAVILTAELLEKH